MNDFKVSWGALSPKLGTWADDFKPFYDLGGFETIYEELKKQGKKGAQIYPKGPDLFKAFEKCPRDKYCAAIIGEDPYVMQKYGKVVADGLAFSCSYTNEEQPSLKLLWDALEDDIYDGLNLEYIRLMDLTPWAKEGILLLNSSLTTLDHDPNQHVDLWQPFMKFFFKKVLPKFKDIPIVFMGKQAEKYAFSASIHHPTLITEHPSYAARQLRPLEHKKMFSFIDECLKNNKHEIINWYDTPF